MTMILLALLTIAASSSCALSAHSLEGDFKRNLLELPKFRF
jgi:hypothetical protein